MSTIPPQGITVRPTSKNSAECDPIVLRVNQMNTARLVFKPVIVNNPANQDASINGHFVYEKKLVGDEWQEHTPTYLTSLKAGQGVHLQLHSEELLALYDELTNLYELHKQQGVPKRPRTFLPVESRIADFLAVAQPDLRKFLDTNQQDAAEMLLRLISWLAQSRQGPVAARRIVSTAPEKIVEMTSLLGVASLKDSIDFYKTNQSNSDEDFWQRGLSTRNFLFSQVFSFPIVVIQQKAYVGGKQLDNQGGGLVDFLAKVAATDSVIFIEIKTPQTLLLGSEYRQVFPLSRELTGAITQVLNYRQEFAKAYYNVKGDTEISTADAKCLVIAGSNRQLHDGQNATAKKDCFELQRQRIRDVTVLTYDELFGRVEQLIHLLEKGIPKEVGLRYPS